MLISVEEAARELGLSQPNLRRWIKEGRISVVRLGRRILIRQEVLEELIRSSEYPAQESKKVRNGERKEA